VYGLQIDGGSASIYTKVQHIAREELREGDLVFFNIRKGRISHVGMYLSNDKFVHATVRSGVIISDLKEAYYQRYFAGAGRF
jgi:lipoprotein Spr